VNVWFTSDHHLGHRAMAYGRKFGFMPEDRTKATDELVEWHDDMLAQRWDAVVSTADAVWVLGDLTANRKHTAAALTWIERRPGTKHLILGNHDPAHPMHEDAHKWQRMYFQVFESVQVAAKRYVPLPEGGRQRVLLSHFPYVGDSGPEDRCSQWRLPNEGIPILHGHTHASKCLTIAESSKQVHVGLDAWDYAPVPLETIGKILS
jgi:calcineurin-like phosphoesterase family protein